VPTETEETASALEDYLELLEALARFGVELVVIGGCAVGAYARLIGEAVFSADLDVLVTDRTESPADGRSESQAGFGAKRLRS